MPKLVIIAALERELMPLIAGWRRTEVRSQNRTIRIFEKGDALVVFGGIGGNSARIAADTAFSHAAQDVSHMISAGLAGGLTPDLKVGDLFIPELVIGDSDNNMIETVSGKGTLVSVGAIAGAAHKKLFAGKYHAQAIDMEAFAVADVARIYNVPFMAMKAISDVHDFDLPPLGRFVTDSGDFRTSAFVAYAAVRPWLWPTVLRLNTNSSIAIKKLCHALEQTLARYAANQASPGLTASL